MSSELMMESGISGKAKLMILGGVVVAFALTIGILMRPGKTDAVEPKPVAVKSAQAAPAVPAAASAEQTTVDTQLASNEMATQTEASADDAMSLESATATANLASQPAQQVVAYVPQPAAADPATELQDTGDWSEAAVDDSNMGGSDQDVAAQARVSQPRPAVRPPPPPAIDALHPWWRDPAQQQGFDVQYVGQAASEKALVFRFSKSIADAQIAAQHIRVTDDKGEAASGVWRAGNNPYVLVYQGVPAGRYIVSIDATLASAGGAKLGTAAQGPIYVQ